MTCCDLLMSLFVHSYCTHVLQCLPDEMSAIWLMSSSNNGRLVMDSSQAKHTLTSVYFLPSFGGSSFVCSSDSTSRLFTLLVLRCIMLGHGTVCFEGVILG